MGMWPSGKREPQDAKSRGDCLSVAMQSLLSASCVGRKSDARGRERERGEGRQMDEVCVVCSKPNSYPLDATPTQTKLFSPWPMVLALGGTKSPVRQRTKQLRRAIGLSVQQSLVRDSHRYGLRLY